MSLPGVGRQVVVATLAARARVSSANGLQRNHLPLTPEQTLTHTDRLALGLPADEL